MKIGLIVAIETDAIFEHYKNYEKLDSPAGFELWKTKSGSNEIFVLHTGMGICAASAGVQYLVTGCGVELIVNFGVVGGLTEEMGKHKVCVIDRVVHYKYDCSEFMDLAVGQVDGYDSIYLENNKKLIEKALAACPELTVSTCCSGDKFVGTAEEKRSIHEKFNGDVCDMESAGIVLTCNINKVPCLMLKAVSDGLAGGAGEFYEELKLASLLCLKVTDSIIENL